MLIQTNHFVYSMSDLSASLEKPKYWVEVHAIAAEHGDCIVVSYGDGMKHFRLVVDAGVASTAERLTKVLSKSGDAVWELLVVTHIDLDHIGGTLSLLSDKSIATRFGDIWFNGRQHLELGRESMAVAEGRQLAELLGRDGVSWNQAFGQSAVCLTEKDMPVYKTLCESKAIITILSPSRDQLAALRKVWDLWVERESAPATPTDIKSEANSLDHTNIEALSAGHASISDLADTPTRTDGSVTNGSSIAFIFEYGGIRILLGADAHAGVLLKSAAKLPLEELSLDLFKLPHHGSSANLTKRLALKLPARRYLFTTDGERHETHPSDIAIARALTATPDALLLFNYPNGAYERWANRSRDPGFPFEMRTGKEEEGISIRLESVPGEGVREASLCG
ncbi:hypothetical protein ACEN9H_31600 [Massilia cellulosiltytica]|uniref:hypothetical protein n=1 Tax=Massilia cellulosiltytica TaxID=2683234 RepID=UPI0039B5D597